jgi:hypothetical protein
MKQTGILFRYKSKCSVCDVLHNIMKNVFRIEKIVSHKPDIEILYRYNNMGYTGGVFRERIERESQM